MPYLDCHTFSTSDTEQRTLVEQFLKPGTHAYIIYKPETHAHILYTNLKNMQKKYINLKYTQIYHKTSKHMHT